MAKQEHINLLRQGTGHWNSWRKTHQDTRPDLSGAFLIGANLIDANLNRADLSRANLIGADLIRANLIRADLIGADLSGANLIDANFIDADLSGANLSDAVLSGANLSGANLSDANLSRAVLSGANLSGATIGGTHFASVDLRPAERLETLTHNGPSHISIDTIYKSQGMISEVFLRKAGVSDDFITYMRSLVTKPIDYYTCFISYSSKDQHFVERLYADLQNRGVRCWYAPEDLNVDDKIRIRIDESIRIYDKLLLVLSEHSIASPWVAYEVERALNKEPQGVPNVLFPVRLDRAILTCPASWAQDIQSTRHIGDFEHWKNYNQYQQSFNRLLRALQQKTPRRET